MKWKNLGILAVVFASLSAYVYFYEIKGEKKREEAEEKAKKLFQFEEKGHCSNRLEESRRCVEFAKRQGQLEDAETGGGQSGQIHL